LIGTFSIHEHKFTFKHLCWLSITKILRNGPRAHFPFTMAEVHEGICGTHQSAPKMKWLLRRSGFYWPNMIADCFKYYKGCQVCQKFGDLQLVPAAELHPIIKPWPFRGWGLDFIGEIHPSSSKGYRPTWGSDSTSEDRLDLDLGGASTSPDLGHGPTTSQEGPSLPYP
jgi:hypothetical protein